MVFYKQQKPVLEDMHKIEDFQKRKGEVDMLILGNAG